MAMTKAEKAKMEELETALALCWPGYENPTPMTRKQIEDAPKVAAGEQYGRLRMAAAGFFMNSYSGLIEDGFSDGMYHSRSDGSSWSQASGGMYATKRDAAMALRCSMSAKFAQQLAAVDRIIREES